MGCGYRKRKEIEKRQKMKERNTLKRERVGQDIGN